MATLSDTERQYLIELLETGEEIPSSFKNLIFPPEKQEHELVYAGKEREEDILAETMAVPLQQIRTFGGNGHQSHNMLIFGDNLQVMKMLLKMKDEGQLRNADGTDGVKLIYIDPPFATKQEFRAEERAYGDKKAGAEFLEFLRKRLILLRELLSVNGTLYVHLDHKKGHYIKVLLDELFGSHNYRNGIARIKCNPKNYTSRTFGNIHDYIYVYSKSDETQINEIYLDRLAHQVLTDFPHIDEKNGKRYKTVPLHARGIRQGETGTAWRGIEPPAGNHWRYIHATLDALDASGLIEWSSTGNPRKIIYADDSEGYAVQDIWDFKDPGERQALYPTEKSLDLIKHIVLTSSNPGDIVLDAFAGSGTTLAAAEELERKWIGIDCGKLAIYTIQKRILNIAKRNGNRVRKVKPAPFTLYNAGLYDFSRLKELPWDGWRSYALGLFQCKDSPHKIKGIKLDGYRDGDEVLVFNHRLSGGVVLDYGFIENLHGQIGSRIGSRFYIVAPAASVVFLEDYIDLESTRYYILRIPYSIINELHTRDFEAITQPVDETEVNDLVEAVGFDFIQQPKVVCDYFLRSSEGQMFKEAIVNIRTFKSEALAKGASLKQNLETLSMVLVDYNYPHDPSRTSEDHLPPFELDHVFYANQIRDAGWEVRMPVEALGEYAMFIYMDIYGNEYTEVKSRTDFSIS